MMTDEDRLDDAKRRFLGAQAEIATLRQQIAAAACPLSVGDQVTVVDRGKTYDGVVEDIHYALTAEELLDPAVGAPTLWAASGHRVNKSTGAVGKWSFAIVSDSATLEDGKWVLAERGIEAALGLAPLKTA